MAINVGDVVELTATFTVKGVPTAPTTATVRIRKPDRTLIVATPAVAGPTVTHEVPVDQPGVWRFEITGTGAAAGAEDSTFSVENPRT